LVAKIRGQLDAALHQYRAVLERRPDYPGYAQLASLKHFSVDDADIALLERAFGRLTPDASPEVRADLLFALAKACDDAERIEEASRYLVEANRIERERRPYDPAADEARMLRIQELFTREFIERYRGGGLTGLQPIFVVSLPRSGSTLTEQMLAAHSAIRGGGEIGHFLRVATALSLKWGARADFPRLDETVAGEDLREAARDYAKLTVTLRLLTPRFTDKTLVNFLYVGLIAMMLPDAKIIHVRRHPLATVLGIYRQHFARGLAYSFDLDAIVAYYRAYAQLMRHWRRVAADAFTEIFYERLIADPEAELGRALDYVGLEFEPRCLEFYRLDRPVRTASVIQVRQPLNRQGLERHQRYEKLLAPVATALADEIAAYEAELAAAGH
ncbi:MAG TPA: sulfotransferase, partial [Gammaproteobacteria bacterium]|nr:sulfotransferase [Gammaproteobacteria bacterium]